MRTLLKPNLLVGLLLAVLAANYASGVETIIYDNYNAVPNTIGFALQKGINSGITNTSGTRLTGTLITVDNRNLRYINTGLKPDSVYSMNSGGTRARVGTDNHFGQFTLSTGGSSPTAFDFASAIGSGGATPGNPLVYDVAIGMENNDGAMARMSFGISTTAPAPDPNTIGNDTFDFGVQIYRAATGDANNTVGKLIDFGSSGVTDIKAPIETTTVAMGSLISFLIRVTDAGSESGANYHSRVQVSRNAGSTWIYDTDTDENLPNGWRFDGATRYLVWDVAQDVNSATFENFSVKVYTSTWNGGGGGNDWSTAANWSSDLVPSTTVGEQLTFAGSTRLTPNMEGDYSIQGLKFASGAGSFTIGATAGKTLTLHGDILQNSANAQTLNTPMAIAATRTVNTASGDLTIGGAISGAGGITKTGSSTLTLGGANTYSGSTTVSAGTVRVNNTSGSGTGSGAVAVQTGATLGGSGAISGAVTVNSGGTLDPGAAANSIGTLTLNAAPSLSGTVVMQIHKSDSVCTADKVSLTSGGFNYGGTLTVTELAGSDALSGGEVFDLFDAAEFTGSFGTINLPTLPTQTPALNWYTGNLAVNGTIAVNRAPTADDYDLTRAKGVSMKINKASLSADLIDKASDADDGDTLSYDGLVSLTSNQGVAVTETTAYYLYYPINDNADWLDYKVKDNRGGLVTKKLNITVEPFYGSVHIQHYGGGQVTLSFWGIPGYSYFVQRSCGDTSHFEDLAVNNPVICSESGLVTYTDTPGSECNPAFYRLRTP
ncbi:MAG TPA: autotransporter-associated beta strand repeat-containing protein [Candidatus Paceibacterota bacterium]|nr:autotransporter-associated beta strand repeat-containing protein [Verrucomicrobiota bacterium]HSA11382.1 autotransporter-associated beta strand repeat-containing protein [Candidatus Paceibacterota bacterium]